MRRFLPAPALPARPSPPNSPFAVIEGEEESYVLLTGGAILCEGAATRLRSAGYEVLRTGRYLGKSLPGVDADWFVRVVTPIDRTEPLRDALTRLFGIPPAPEENSEPTAAFRARLVASELSAARAREAGLRAEVAQIQACFGRHRRD